MIKYDKNSIFIIGGRQNFSVSNRTWIVDPEDGFSIREGPPLNQERDIHKLWHSFDDIKD